jgi:hypothetical protein
MNSSDDEGLMDFVMKKDISKHANNSAAQNVNRSMGMNPLAMKISGGNPLINKFKPSIGAVKPLGATGSRPMFMGKTLAINKHRMKSLNLSHLNK